MFHESVSTIEELQYEGKSWKGHVWVFLAPLVSLLFVRQVWEWGESDKKGFGLRRRRRCTLSGVSFQVGGGGKGTRTVHSRHE